jgi:NAD(P)-dependent dehydrogenase (short-subunit alcohol dehydrogenase family)
VTSSIGGLDLANIGENGTFAYAAAKAGVIHLVRQLAVDLGPRHINTNSIAPGFFVTESSAPFIEKYGGEDALAATYPNGKLGKGEDFAATAVFLASRGASHINGHCILVDGGGIIGRIGQTNK